MNALFDDIKKTQLIEEFNALLADTESLLSATATQSGDKIAALRSKLGSSIQLAKENICEMEAAILDQTKAAAKATDAYVHDNPWQSVGIAVSVGFIVGWLMKRH